MLRKLAGPSLALAIMGVLIFALGPTLAAGAVLALGLAIVVVRFPVLGIGVLVAILPFNALVSQVVEGVAATAYGALKDGILALILVNALVTKRVRFVPRSITVLVTLLILLPLISGLLAPSFEQALFGWRIDYEPLILLVAVAAVVERRHIRPLMLMIALVAQVSAGVSILTWNRGLQWLFDIGRLPVADQRDFPTSLFSQGSIVPRAFSPYVAPNEMAAAMLIALAVIWCLADVRGRTKLVLTVLPTIALVLTESRSGLLGGVILFMVLVARAVRSRSALLANAFLMLATVGVMSAAFLSIVDSLENRSDSSFGGHADSLQEGLRQLLQHPLGMGLGTVGPRALQFDVNYHVESFWLLLALESGPVVFALFFILLIRLVVGAGKSQSIAGFAIAAALAGTVVSQIVLPTLQDGPVSFLLWIVGGLSLAAQRFERQDRERAEFGVVSGDSHPQLAR